MFFLHRIFQALLVISRKEDDIIRLQLNQSRKITEIKQDIKKLQESVDNLSKPNMATRLEISPDS